MKRFLILIMLVLAGCAESEEEAIERIKGEVNSSGTITDEQAESLSKVEYLTISEACQKLIDKYKKP